MSGNGDRLDPLGELRRWLLHNRPVEVRLYLDTRLRDGTVHAAQRFPGVKGSPTTIYCADELTKATVSRLLQNP